MKSTRVGRDKRGEFVYIRGSGSLNALGYLAMDVSVSLPENVADFIKEKVPSGHFGSSSEVVSEALRLMQEAEREDVEKFAWLSEAWRKGVASGDAGELNFAELNVSRARV